MGTILIVVLVLLLLGAIPVWPHSKSWGYYPTGGLGLVLTILVILIAFLAIATLTFMASFFDSLMK